MAGFASGFSAGAGVVNNAYALRAQREQLERENRLQDEDRALDAKDRLGREAFAQLGQFEADARAKGQTVGQALQDESNQERLQVIYGNGFFKDKWGEGKDFGGFGVGPDGKIVPMVKVDGPEGGKTGMYPMTKNRSSDPDDPVVAFDPDALWGETKAELAIHGDLGAGERKAGMDERFFNQLAGPAPSGLAAATPGAAPPQAVAPVDGSEAAANSGFRAKVLAAQQQGATYQDVSALARTTEQRATVDEVYRGDQLTSEELVPETPPAAPRSLREAQSAKDQAVKEAVVTAIPRAVDFLKKNAVEGDALRLAHAVDPENPLGIPVRRNPELYTKPFVRSSDVLRASMPPEQYAQVQELMRPALEAEMEKLTADMEPRDGIAGFADGMFKQVATRRAEKAAYRMAEIDAAMAPVAEDAPPPQPEPTVPDVRSPTKLAETAGNRPPPTPEQARVGQTSVVANQRGKLSGKERQEMLWAYQNGYVTEEQVSRRMKTGSYFAGAEIKLQRLGDVTYATDGTNFTVVEDSRGAGKAEDNLKLAKQGRTELDDMLTSQDTPAFKTNKADFYRRLGESSLGLIARGIPVDLTVLAGQPVAQAALVTAYQDAQRMDTPEGWFGFREASEKLLSEAYDARYGRQQSQPELSEDGSTLTLNGRSVNIAGYAEKYGLTPEQAYENVMKHLSQ